MKRRNFLRVSGCAAGAMVAGASLSRASVGKRANIFLVREEDTARALMAALASTGELGFVKRGDSVLIKPAVNSAQKWPATSSPELVKLLVRTLKDRGAGEVIVADRSALGRDTRECMRKAGLLDAASDAGAKVVFFKDEPYVELELPDARAWGGTIMMPEIVRDVDHVISLPTVRTHVIGGFTMSIKNWVGLVPVEKRRRMHIPAGFPQRVGELTLLRQADLILLDGRLAFIDKGPDSGTLAKPGLFAAGTDPVAMDVLGLAILTQFGSGRRISGRSPWRNTIIARAAKVAGGARSGADIEIDARGVSELPELAKFMEVPD